MRSGLEISRNIQKDFESSNPGFLSTGGIPFYGLQRLGFPTIAADSGYRAVTSAQICLPLMFEGLSMGREGSDTLFCGSGTR
ncbi:MAG: hypothetical protein AUJ07_09090 [Crenarchaeota archaeon 13_1_40CM_3_53_5]|nr:MAG: hypothetical protein AUJ07_09090 [Crenarchaeota archaeon 13_1_40CM_3_53_5]